jgi:tetratricopeptide (TPR) repeat protein
MAQQFVSTERAITGLLELLRTNQVDAAVKTYTSFQEDIGFPLLSRVVQDPAMQKAVANLFYRARDYPKAAMCCENLGEFEKAALLYEKCQDYEMAADMYARLSMPLRSAEMFEKAQKHRQAAELFMQGGDAQRAAVNFEKALSHYHAGKLYFQLERLNKSMELLQKVRREEDEFIEAALLIAYILERNGHVDLAIRKLQGVELGPLDQKTSRIYYRLADLFAKKGMKDDAKRIFGDIAAWDFNYMDARQRLENLEKGGSGVLQAGNEEVAEFEAGVPEIAVTAEASQVVSVMEGFEYLKQLPLFEDLSLQEMKALYTRCEQKVFKPGDRLITQGVAGETLFILTAGEFQVRRVAEGGEARVVATLGAGHYVGEMSLIDDAPTSAEVIASSPGTALAISKQAFTVFLGSNDHVALRVYRVFVRTMCERLRKTNEQLSAQK